MITITAKTNRLLTAKYLLLALLTLYIGVLLAAFILQTSLLRLTEIRQFPQVT